MVEHFFILQCFCMYKHHMFDSECQCGFVSGVYNERRCFHSYCEYQCVTNTGMFCIASLLLGNACKNNYQMLIHILCGIQVF